MARRAAAIRFLEGCGFHVWRDPSDNPLPTWHVSTWGRLSGIELVEAARESGFDPENFDAAAVKTFECRKPAPGASGFSFGRRDAAVRRD